MIAAIDGISLLVIDDRNSLMAVTRTSIMIVQVIIRRHH